MARSCCLSELTLISLNAVHYEVLLMCFEMLSGLDSWIDSGFVMSLFLEVTSSWNFCHNAKFS